jgi:hypothetical protein
MNCLRKSKIFNAMDDHLKILHLNLKKKWFDMILSGEKTEEYREVKPYWTKRLSRTGVDKVFIPKEFDIVEFRNGYGKDAPMMRVVCNGIVYGEGNTSWGAPKNVHVYKIKLGNIISSWKPESKPVGGIMRQILDSEEEDAVKTDVEINWPDELNVDGLKSIQDVQDDLAIVTRCLQALVDLKDYKDEHGKDDYYLRNQPKAWEYARQVLKDIE